MALPTNISYGTVVGQFLASVADGSDVDTLPDGVPMKGTVMFLASTGYVLDYSATPNPVTIVKTPITCQLDSNGYLCGPYQSSVSPLVPGVSLVATDDADLQPVGWNWTVIYNLTDPLGNRVNMPTQSINVPTGTTVDLTTAMNIASSGGVMITKGDKGDQGIQGLQGIQGVKGDQGIQGIQGVQGNPGDMVSVSGPANVSGAVDLSAVTFPSTRLWTLTGNITSIILPTPASNISGTFTLVMTQDATGSRTVTWPAMKWPDGIVQQPATAASSVTMFNLLWTGTQWLGMLGGKSFA